MARQKYDSRVPRGAIEKLVLLEGTGHKLDDTHSDVVMDAIDEVMEASGR